MCFDGFCRYIMFWYYLTRQARKAISHSSSISVILRPEPVLKSGLFIRLKRRTYSQYRIRKLLKDFEPACTMLFPDSLQKVREMTMEAAGKSRVIIVAGGDGTISTAACSIAGSSTLLGIIPAGSGNDIARSLKIPCNKKKAAGLLRQFLGKGNSRQTGHPDNADISRIAGGSAGPARHGKDFHSRIRDIFAGNVSYWPEKSPKSFNQQDPEQKAQCRFINTLGIGYDGHVAGLANRIRFPAGRFKYMAGILISIFRWRGVQMKVSLGEEVITERLLMTTIANGPFEGGGIQIAPGADPSGRNYTVIMIRDVRKCKRIWLLLRIMIYGADNHPDIIIRRSCNVRIQTSDPVPFHADGEVFKDLTSDVHAVKDGKSVRIITPL